MNTVKRVIKSSRPIATTPITLYRQNHGRKLVASLAAGIAAVVVFPARDPGYERRGGSLIPMNDRNVGTTSMIQCAPSPVVAIRHVVARRRHHDRRTGSEERSRDERPPRPSNKMCPLGGMPEARKAPRCNKVRIGDLRNGVNRTEQADVDMTSRRAAVGETGAASRAGMALSFGTVGAHTDAWLQD